jgi:hypothetical protein
VHQTPMARGETFRWQECLYDIDRLVEDIAAGALQPTLVELEAPFIFQYCSLYLDPAMEHRPPIHVNSQYACTLRHERSQVPIVLLHVGEGQGVVSLNNDTPEPHYVVADGNHRLLAAKQDGHPLRAYVLSAAESSRYEVSLERRATDA